MRRFMRNRWWTFILALSIASASSLALPHSARALDPDPAPDDAPISGDNQGDPDQPNGGGGKLSHRGVPARRPMGIGRTPVGDGGMASARMWRLVAVGQGLRIFLFRF